MSIPEPWITCTNAYIGTCPYISYGFGAYEQQYKIVDMSILWSSGTARGTISVPYADWLDYSITDWSIPPSVGKGFPNGTQGTVTLTLIVVYHSDATGYVEYSGGCTFTAKVNPTTSAPTISLPQVRDENPAAVALTGDASKIIKHISDALMTVNAEARNGATLKHVYVSNGNVTIETPPYMFQAVSSEVFSVHAVDSRGLSTTIKYTIPAERVIEYIKLTCNAGNERPDTSGNMRLTCSGNYYNGSFGAKDNTLKVEYRYKEQGGEFGAWTAMVASVSGNTYSASAELSGLDYRATYVFECRATDEAMTISSADVITQAMPVFHWGAGDFVFEVPVTFKQGAFGKGVETMEAGEWTPTLTTAAAVSSYSTRRGWYVRTGNVVTIGFNIGASCKSGYNSTALAISGLPFTPAVNAFGGGVMFGAYVNAGFCFEAWCATTGGQITPRLQPCNNTTAGNLQISSTAYYPTGANTVTLGGTITYITN